MLRRAEVAPLGNGKVLYLRGTPYQQGKQLGEGAAELIQENIRRASQLRHRIAPDLDLRAYRAMTRRNEKWVLPGAKQAVRIVATDDEPSSLFGVRSRDGGLKPPDAASVAASTGVAAAVADRMLKLLQRQKVLVRVDVLLFHDEALKRLKAEVTALKTSAGAGARIDVATFKERFGVTRKFAIPLLEYLDRERVTRRMGESRVVL